MSPTEIVLARLPDHRRNGSGWEAKCPVPEHDDHRASLSIGTGDNGAVLLKCHRGCATQSIVNAIGLKMKDLFVPKVNGSAKPVITATYDYTDEAGNLLFQVVRFRPKDFRQRSPDGNGGWTWSTKGVRRVLYKLPALLNADPTSWVFVTEGEKDAEALAQLGMTATTNPQGAGKWAHVDDAPLAGLRVCILPDNDEPGEAHAQDVGTRLYGKAGEIKIVRLPGIPPKGDVSDWLAGGGNAEQLLKLVESSPVFEPNAEARAPIANNASTPLCTDLGNAIRFAEQHGHAVRYCHPWGAWLVWDGKRWAQDETGEIERRAKRTANNILDEAKHTAEMDAKKRLAEWAMTSQKRERLAAMIACARSEPGIPIVPTAIDRDAWLLNCVNGVIDLRTGRLLPHHPDRLITKLCLVPFNADATAPRFERFMLEIMDNNEALIGFLQRLLGCCITGDVSEHVLIVLWGRGRNGKNTLIEVVLYVLGDYGCMAPPDLLTVRHGEEHPTILADLHGRRLVVASETDEGRRLRVQLVKSLTGDAKIKARRMRQDYWEFDRSHKTLLMTNNRPVITEDSAAIWSRLKLVPFCVSFEGREDKHLGDALRAEAPGILAWLVRGCLAWQRDGLAEPDEVKEATAGYRSDEDILAPYLEDRCIIGPSTLMVSRGAIWCDYDAWAKRNRERRPLSRNSLYDRLRRRGFEECSFREHGEVVRGFQGVAVRCPGPDLGGQNP